METSEKKEAINRLTIGLLDLIILKYLKSEPMYPYQIISNIKDDGGGSIGPGTIYPHIDKLECKGYVISEPKIVKNRCRRVYKLTKKGKDFLNYLLYSHNLLLKNVYNKEPKLTELLVIPLMEEEVTY